MCIEAAKILSKDHGLGIRVVVRLFLSMSGTSRSRSN
jgi:hypothetical protein